MKRTPRGLLLLPVLAVFLALELPQVARAGVVRDVVYLPEAEDADSQSLDLYLPEGGERAAPLVAFVHSRFWAFNDGGHSLAGSFARPLMIAGVAVAIVRHRLAPAYVHPAQAQDVAAAVAFLLRSAERYGYDPARVFLAGHSSGAHLAALVALDGRYLAEAGAAAGDLAGVIAVSGSFDLTETDAASEEERRFVAQAFPSEQQRREASPLRHVGPDAPPFLVLVAGDDIPSVLPGSRTFTEALRSAGQERSEGLLIKAASHYSILDFRPLRCAAREGILAFVNGERIQADPLGSPPE